MSTLEAADLTPAIEENDKKSESHDDEKPAIEVSDPTIKDKNDKMSASNVEKPAIEVVDPAMEDKNDEGSGSNEKPAIEVADLTPEIEDMNDDKKKGLKVEEESGGDQPKKQLSGLAEEARRHRAILAAEKKQEEEWAARIAKDNADWDALPQSKRDEILALEEAEKKATRDRDEAHRRDMDQMRLPPACSCMGGTCMLKHKG